MPWLVCLVLSLFIFASVAYRDAEDHVLEKMARGSFDSLDVHRGDLLTPLLVKRVSGTPANAVVRDWIADFFKRLGWHVALDSFTDTTPYGTVPFTNVIATKDPTAEKRLVLAAHFDSKFFEKVDFIGATDSSVPCAILMDIARTLNASIETQHDMTLQFIFFDGEEAIVNWDDKDSIYGARHLASSWETTFLEHPRLHSTKHTTVLGGIDVLVLLDLLGTPNIKIGNYYQSTSWLFDHLVRLEDRMRRLGLLESVTADGQYALESFFDPTSPLTFRGELIGDDHVPFRLRGVPILHIIPSRFPSVWHQPTDNADCLDPATIRNWARLWRAFTLEYLELNQVV